MASSSSSPLAAAPAAPTTLLDLPSHVLGQRIVAHDDLDAASRLALFRASHALARMVLLHAPGSKRLTVDGSKGWSGALPHLLGTRWQPLPLADLELKVRSSLPPPPPTAISQRVSHLHLHQCSLTGHDLAEWRLHDTVLWQHLQHLTVHDCFYQAPSSNATPQLPPIPHLRSFTWHASNRHVDHVEVLGLLAANATQTHLHLPPGRDAVCVKVLEHLQQLTHCHLQRVEGDQVVQALLQHPTLQHVTMCMRNHLVRWPADLNQQPCRWRTLTLRGAQVSNLGKLLLANLERLTISESFNECYPAASQEETAAGVASLQQLHSGGRLVVLPWPDNEALTQRWHLQRGSGLFSFWSDLPSTVMALLRLVLEAGRGIDTLQGIGITLSSTQLREEVASLLQHSGRIHTLCFTLVNAAGEDWWGSLLSALPSCITHVKVDIVMVSAPVLKALVLSALASLAHPLKLTILHQGGINPTLEAELLQLVAGRSGGGAAACGGGVPVLTLEVV